MPSVNYILVVLSWCRKREDTKWNVQCEIVFAISSTVYLLCSQPLDIVTRTYRKARVIFTLLPGTGADRGPHTTRLRTTQPDLAEPGEVGGAQRWLMLRRSDYPSMPMRDNTAQSWTDPSCPSLSTRGLPDSAAPLLLQSTPRHFRGCYEVGQFVTCWKTCRRLIIPHVEPVSSLNSTRNIFSMCTRYPGNYFEVISLELV